MFFKPVHRAKGSSVNINASRTRARPKHKPKSAFDQMFEAMCGWAPRPKMSYSNFLILYLWDLKNVGNICTKSKQAVKYEYQIQTLGRKK